MDAADSSGLSGSDERMGRLADTMESGRTFDCIIQGMSDQSTARSVLASSLLHALFCFDFPHGIDRVPTDYAAFDR